MNWDQIKSDWDHVSDLIKVTWGKLSDDDLTRIAGDREHLTRLLVERYDYENAQAVSKVDKFANGLPSAPAKNDPA